MTMEFTGRIVRRRSLGKNLAFADIQRDADDNDQDTEEANDGGATCTTTRRMVQIAFRRTSPSWDTLRDDTFPTKVSSLPYGARVRLNLRTRILSETIIQKGPSLEVHDWDIIGASPRKVATKAATEEGADGISCSKYLKSRGDVFLRFNQHPDPSNLNHKTNKNRERIIRHNNIRQPVDTHAKSGSNSCCSFPLESPPSNGHGDKKAKALRAKVFTSWLLDTFGADNLKQPGGVLDIAGGKGQLSVELSAMGQIPCTIIDPLLRKRLPPKQIKRVMKARGPTPRHLAKPFDTQDFLQDFEQLVEDANCLIGLHPDECTEDILDVALKYKKPVAIVPCCVFPDLFPTRKMPCGTTVRTYEAFLQYLLKKDSRLKKATLSFEGKNQVIYCHID